MSQQAEADRLAKITEDYIRALENIRLAYQYGWIKTKITRLPYEPGSDAVRYAVSLVPTRKIRIL